VAGVLSDSFRSGATGVICTSEVPVAAVLIDVPVALETQKLDPPPPPPPPFVIRHYHSVPVCRRWIPLFQ
jgi:hypothetical protein